MTNKPLEFIFQFKQVNFWALHYLYLNLKEEDFHGRVIELENEAGIIWTPANTERDLMVHFNKPFINYKVRIKEDKNDLEWYKCIFNRFSDYTHYLSVHSDKESSK